MSVIRYFGLLCLFSGYGFAEAPQNPSQTPSKPEAPTLGACSVSIHIDDMQERLEDIKEEQEKSKG